MYSPYKNREIFIKQFGKKVSDKPESDFELLDSQNVYTFTDPCHWHSKTTVRRKILTYKGNATEKTVSFTAPTTSTNASNTHPAQATADISASRRTRVSLVSQFRNSAVRPPRGLSRTVYR